MIGVLAGIALVAIVGFAGLVAILWPLDKLKEQLHESRGARVLATFGSLVLFAIAYISGVGWFEGICVALLVLTGFYWFLWIDDH